jgi:peptidoglycan/LPS O-acetylase OafA/YrhL
MSIIALVSFGIQSSLDGDLAHMLLFSRLWQFMAGFVTFHLHESKRLNVENLFTFSKQLEIDEQDKKSKFRQTFLFLDFLDPRKTKLFVAELIKLALLCMLLFGILNDTIHNFIGQLHRLSVVLVTMLIMAQNTPSYFLTLKPLVALGDCSYSVYLVHWPLFNIHRYWYPEWYSQNLDYPTLVGGMLLISASITLGYLMEEMFKFICRHIKTWTSLLLVIITMYLCLGLLLTLVHSQIRPVSRVSECN